MKGTKDFFAQYKNVPTYISFFSGTKYTTATLKQEIQAEERGGFLPLSSFVFLPPSPIPPPFPSTSRLALLICIMILRRRRRRRGGERLLFFPTA